MPKQTKRGDPLGFFNIHFVAKQQEKLKGGPFAETNFPKKKSRSAEKKIERGTLWSRPVWYVTGKTGKTVLVKFTRANGAV